jgi:hypothetical protein
MLVLNVLLQISLHLQDLLHHHNNQLDSYIQVQQFLQVQGNLEQYIQHKHLYQYNFYIYSDKVGKNQYYHNNHLGNHKMFLM